MALFSNRNFLHILRDIADAIVSVMRREEDVRKNRFRDEEIAAGKFDVILTASIASEPLPGQTSNQKTPAPDPGKERVDTGNKSAPGKIRSSSNYLQMYVENRELEAAKNKPADTAQATEATKKAEAKKIADEKAAAEKAAAEKAANEYRYRAREIQEQILWWQKQTDAGQYDESTINGNIYTLKQQLGAIPPEYWP